MGNSGNRNQIFCCDITITLKLNDPQQIIIFKIANPIDISYEIICAADLNEPRYAYFELLDHPANKIP